MCSEASPTSLKRAFSMVLTQGLRHYRGNGSQRGFQLWRNCQQIALPSVDSQSREMLPVPVMLYDALQILQRIFLQVAFDISREAFAQYLGASLQVPAQGTFLTQRLVIRGRERDQRDAHDEGNNEPDAE